MGYSNERVYTIVAAFDPADLPTKELNEETPKGAVNGHDATPPMCDAIAEMASAFHNIYIRKMFEMS